MLEITTSRHNPLIDPQLAVWSWEIPVYLFLGGIVAGMMILGGFAMLRIARGEDGKNFFSMQTPLLAFVLLNLGMLALLLDLTHRLYVWRIYLAFRPSSPMSWGSWVLIIVYGVLLLSALVRLPEAWPWLGRKFPRLGAMSAAIASRPQRMVALAWSNIVLGVGLGIYTGILLNTMVARPLWNTAILAPLFLVSGLSAGAAMVHLASAIFPGHPAPQGLFGGLAAVMLQPIGEQPPDKGTAVALVRADIVFLAVELVMIGLLFISLYTSTPSHAVAASLLLGGSYAWAFWGGVVGIGIVVPIVWQALELGHRIRHTFVPALLVLAGGFTLRWVMVGAGQLSQIVPAAVLGQ